MKKRLIVLFDGTWNTREDRTNVERISQTIVKVAPDGVVQERWYIPVRERIGTTASAGALLDSAFQRTFKKGYRWVADEWPKAEENELYVFGFSRGAYTARSLVGLIRKSGLLQKPDKKLVEQAYALYRNKDVSPDSAEADAFRAAHSREIRVKFIGVWDTVGCLGVPLTGALIPWDEITINGTIPSSVK